MSIRLIIILCFSLGQMSYVWSEETCSRVAVINHQKVLVDTSSTKKGEGLRYYIDKDPVAKNYLDTYQDKSRPNWANAAVGTLGTSLLIGGLFTSDSPKDPNEKFNNKEILLGSGAIIILLNFIVARTNSYNNEKYLNKAVEEYNKRNTPKIFFTPYKNNIIKDRSPGSIKFGFNFSKDF